MDKRWEKLFSFKGKTNIETIKAFLKDLNFSKNFKIINVVGTNGKGSSTNMIAEALVNSGKKVGVFTSPHLVKPNERISINGKNIEDEDFFEIYNRFHGKHFFSSLFIVAMKYFQEQNIDIAVVEAGVGGKNDSTNAIDGDYGLLTSVGMDHMNFLGDTHQKIYEDKIGIFNDGMEFFIPSILPKDIKTNRMLKVINNEGETYQLRNSKLVEKFLKINFGIELGKPNFPRGRTDIVKKNGFECIYEVAHNFDGIKESLIHLKYLGVQFDDVVISLAKRKDLKGIIELFNGKNIKFYKPDDSFRDFDFEEIKDIQAYVPNKKTLFIGSFRLIGLLYG